MTASLLGWLLIAPLAALPPRRRDWVAVIGREDGKFLDNAKYFFLQGSPLLPPGARMVFVSERQDATNWLSHPHYEVMLYPSFCSIWFLVRAGSAVVDSSEWFRGFRRFLLIRAKLVQLWHGVGFKRIELDKWRQEASASRALATPGMHALRKAMHRFTGRLVRYDLLNTTSIFYRDNVFAGAFLSRHLVVTGYPRNTFGEVSPTVRAIAWRNVDQAIAAQVPQWLEQGRRIVLVAPTFRDSRATPMGLSADVVAMLDCFGDQHGVEFIFKFHPLERQASEVRGKHLHLCNPVSDLYPLMPLSRTLISDYSSIYMDYLLLDKPILFLVPDLEEYMHSDRQLQFDFNDMTPGPKLDSWQGTADALLEQWRHDAYVDARSALKRTAFDGLPQIDSVPTLLGFMRSHGYLLDTPRHTNPPS